MAPKASGEFTRVVYCLPVAGNTDVPVPNLSFRRLLDSYGMKADVEFASNNTPARLRENISRMFRETFKLRSQELLQFDYLSLVHEKNELRKPKKLLHFNSKTILSFVGKKNVYLALRQPPQVEGIDFEQPLLQERSMKLLGDDQYNVMMLSVMHRLNSGNHKENITDAERDTVDSLLDSYKLSETQQLVFTGNCFDQLVLFNEDLKNKSFTEAHVEDEGHRSLEETFKKLFTSYHWNKMLEWVIDKVSSCPECSGKAGNSVKIEVDAIVDEIVEKNLGKNVQPYDKEKAKEATASSCLPVSAPLPNPQPAATLQTASAPVPAHVYTVPASQVPCSLQGLPTLQPQRPFQSVPVSQQQRPLQNVVPVQLQPAQVANRTTLPAMPARGNPDGRNAASKRPNSDTGSEESDNEEEVMKRLKVTEQDVPGDVTSQDHKHSAKVLNSMYEMQKRAMYCDFDIFLLPSHFNGLRNPKIFRVHKVVLAALSARVRKIKNQQIKIGGKISPDALRNVIEYAYTGRISNIDNLGDKEITHTSTAALALEIEINSYIKAHRPEFVRASVRVVLNKQLNRDQGRDKDADNDAQNQTTEPSTNHCDARIKAEVIELPADAMDLNTYCSDEDNVDNGASDVDASSSDSDGDAESPEWRPDYGV